MELKEAINIRRSRRKFIADAIDENKVKELNKLIGEYNEIDGIRFELVLNNGKAFNGLRKSYGMFSGVNNYIVLFASKNDKHAAEKLGYYGEYLILKATALGLGSCWVGGTYSKNDIPFDINDDEYVVATIVIGNVLAVFSFKEKFIWNMTHRKSKTIEEMYRSDEDVPSWFLEGMDAVIKAPSAVNRQPVIIEYKSGEISAMATGEFDDSLYLDLGIAKAHFKIAISKGEWQWGNNGEFIF